MRPGPIQKFGKDGRVSSELSRSEDGSVYHEWNDCKDREVVDELILAMAMDTSSNNNQIASCGARVWKFSGLVHTIYARIHRH